MNKVVTYLILLFSCLLCHAQKDTLKPTFDPPGPIYDGIGDAERAAAAAPICTACEAKEKRYNKLKYDYFIKLVYEPAMKDPSLHAGNKAFLEKLKTILACKTSSCNNLSELIRPVYKMKDRTGLWAHRIFEDPYQYKSVKNQNTVSYRLYYSNSKQIDTVTILKSRQFKIPCRYLTNHILKKTSEKNKLSPVFCSPFDLELEFVKDKKTNSLLKKDSDCRNACSWYCDDETQQITFAKLKGVPNLYFTCDTDDWGVWYPARGLFINIDNKYALKIWKFTLEMVECSCI